VSNEITINVDWPITLPLPYVDYEGSPSNTTLVGDVKNGNIQRRSRYHRSYIHVSLIWVFSFSQFEEFKTYFQTTLERGVSQFKISLRYPQNSELTEWAVRFIGGYEAAYLDGAWSIKANVDLVNLVALAEISQTI
jgi:hypothetical protein